MNNFKPMLASPADLDAIRYPVLASYKLDGIRAIVQGGRVMSRKLIEIPNKRVQEVFGRHQLEGLDGEFIFGEPTAPDVYRKTNSLVMSHDKTDIPTLYVFDHVSMPALAWINRAAIAMQLIEKHRYEQIKWLQHNMLHNREELDAFEAKAVGLGYEGVMLRDPEACYKYGRSTAKEGILLKVKRFEDSEAEVIGIEEEMKNNNVAERDNLGRTKRSTVKANKVGKGTMGALVVRDLKTKVEFNIGSGFTAEDRSAEWPLGTIVKYKSFAVGVKDKPRHPVFLGRRSKIDL